jgi:hypothetical protein
MIRTVLLLLLLAAVGAVEARIVAAGNLVYAGDRTSVCFSDRFLTTVKAESGVEVEKRLRSLRLDRWDELSQVSYAVMNGTNEFRLSDEERTNLKRWLDAGGFLLASAGCSSQQWNASFTREIEATCGAGAMQPVTLDHPVFHTLFDIDAVPLSHGGVGKFLGVIRDGRLAVLISPEGLNDTAHTQGCCCCGGNEVKAAEEVVANTLVYALTE